MRLPVRRVRRPVSASASKYMIHVRKKDEPPPTTSVLSPKTVLYVMAFLCCFTTLQFCFQHDVYLLNKDTDPQFAAAARTHSVNDVSPGGAHTAVHDELYWGMPNAEFDWCELNYRWSSYIAEPVNTFTGTVFLLVALLAEYLHSGLMLKRAAHLALGLTAAIGVGTICFHASLRYTAQLIDELPIYYLILLMGSELSPWIQQSHMMRLTLLAWAIFLSIALFTVPQEEIVHEILRGCMSCSFAILFVYTFYAISALAVNHAALQRLFHIAFLTFVFAEMSWLLDNASCPSLRLLPVYPHLHAVWHAFAGLGMYLLWLCVVGLTWCVKHPHQAVYVRYTFWNVPYLIVR